MTRIYSYTLKLSAFLLRGRGGARFRGRWICIDIYIQIDLAMIFYFLSFFFVRLVVLRSTKHIYCIFAKQNHKPHCRRYINSSSLSSLQNQQNCVTNFLQNQQTVSQICTRSLAVTINSTYCICTKYTQNLQRCRKSSSYPCYGII